MNISVINHSDGRVSDEDLQRAIRAINRQIREDFAPYWGMSATLRLEGRSAEKPETVELADLRGDAVIYIWAEAEVSRALGYHFKNNRGIPFGFVFVGIAERIGDPWSVTLSHEALELIADPETNLLVMGPHPTRKRDVFHWFEMCDAVQGETYEVDGIAVSNFVLPLYFTGTRETDELGARNDFLGRVHEGQTLTSFGINPGGYIGFYDPLLEDHDTYTIRNDLRALERLELKSAAKEARRSVRYRQFKERERLRKLAEDGRPSKMPARAPHREMASARGELLKTKGKRITRILGSSARASAGRPVPGARKPAH
jgi:hypothetical protein